jgi:CheY-like chemotaxis protein
LINSSKLSRSPTQNSMKRIYTPIRRPRILLVDDDEMVRSIYQKKLESERFDVELSSDSGHALRMLGMEPFDLVILDFSLPGMNGAQVLDVIRSQPATAALPVIVLSSGYVPNLVQVAAKSAATRCVRKSDCTPRKMMEIVRGFLATSGTFASSVSPGEISFDVGSVPGHAVELLGGSSGKTLLPTLEMRTRFASGSGLNPSMPA